MWEFVKQVETVISFFVRVPVLSEQITVVSPRVSTEGSFLISAFFESIFLTEIAREIVTTAGRPSGTAATARAIEVRSQVFEARRKLRGSPARRIL